jgi:excisionase family DNA binding protein
MADAVSDPVEAYRRAEARLRLLLLGDGMDTVGRVKGQEHRDQVLSELRRMRHSVAAILERPENQAMDAIGLVEELHRIASSRKQPDSSPTSVTPAEAAVALGRSVSTIYRAVRRGDIRAVQPAETRSSALRIPASELHRLLAGSR